MVRQIKNKRRKKEAPKAKADSQHNAYLIGCFRSTLLAVCVIGGLTLLAGTPSKNLIERNPNLDRPNLIRTLATWMELGSEEQIEQRIGRIARIGQEAERIGIWNLCYADTIDQRILERDSAPRLRPAGPCCGRREICPDTSVRVRKTDPAIRSGSVCCRSSIHRLA